MRLVDVPVAKFRGFVLLQAKMQAQRNIRILEGIGKA